MVKKKRIKEIVLNVINELIAECTRDALIWKYWLIPIIILMSWKIISSEAKDDKILPKRFLL